jgi:superfamily II DNA helicase RecQ
LDYKIIYITPEKLVQSPSFIKVLEKLYVVNKIDRFVIDEVHCVSNWGQDFRKDYLSLSMLKQKFPKVPILGLTATATIKVKADLVQ